MTRPTAARPADGPAPAPGPAAPVVEPRPHPDPTPAARRRALLAEPPFGEVFTDHMVTARWTPDDGWGRAVLEPFAPLRMSPAAVGLHYGQSVFEGFKAYRRGPDRAVVFRPADHGRRLAASARRMAVPALPTDLFTAATEALVRADLDWIPEGDDRSLYLRPVVFADEPHLALRPARSYLFLLLAFPTGNFFTGGQRAVTVAVSEEYVRAAPGGTGAAKCGGNYAGSYLAQEEAARRGADQVVWLDAVERRYVEELGGMNLFFVHGEGDRAELVTPPLTGTILPGVTRDTLITLARDRGMRVSEAPVSLADWREGCARGRITEVFACGTAARVTSVGKVLTGDGAWTVGEGVPGPVAGRLSALLAAVHRGEEPDPHHWCHVVDRSAPGGRAGRERG
ncbi:branched-chain amino acid aminotransferase [Streptomyces griseoviridis]|jgi:branched-chain amino acid aminotransferase|uniref:Branched-chain-amino-acid aminotransferase n=2 Tax=Streptomyces TaxID=1883 RepID=A0A918LG62_STRGD|nr:MULTISPECIES: branched-chain amino acid aminotransferase [Streptomyces]GGS44248.1 branched-chain-amino-acid aminotransferase [Streptomyces niveoruber]GGU14065.1 branched-chain-amino-acid aminotransferase [Streptomyces daghestanicus]GHI34993.1 branched-chain-amino-acid aminotransferase [Streptomyces daghestanicus]